MNNETTNIEQPTPTADTGERLFTQDEVNQIIKDRLKRERAKPDPELTQRESALTERETALLQRETAMECREYLAQRGYPAEFLEILGTSDFDSFKKKADRVAELTAPKSASAPPLRVYDGGGSALASAFRDTSHRPRPYGYNYEECY